MEESSDHCDTELCLTPGRQCRRRSSHADCSANSSRAEEKKAAAAGKAPQPQQQEQQITIFYNGRICICDVTEIQARAVISMANRELDMEAKKKQSAQLSRALSFPSVEMPSTPAVAQPQVLNRSVSMKRSLQSFLQKRKTRSLESSPYDHHHQHLPSS